MKDAPGTRSDGRPFPPEVVEAVWRRAEPVETFPGYRRDAFGLPMRQADYGNTEARCGWVIEHVTPPAEGGSDDPDNLRAVHWQNRATRG